MGTDPELKENIIRDIFLKLGYEVGEETAFRIGNGRSSLKFDLLVKKAHRTYAVEIKRFGGKRYLHPEALEPFVNAVDTLLETSAKPVLVTDREVLTNAAQEYLLKKNILLLDKTRIGKMILGEDVLKGLDK